MMLKRKTKFSGFVKARIANKFKISKLNFILGGILCAITYLVLMGANSPTLVPAETDSFEKSESITNSTITQFRNNLDVVLIADPMILKDENNYYLYATDEETINTGFKVWKSTDLVNWKYKGICFQKNTETWSQKDFWAPECVKNGNSYYLYFSAASSSGPRRICVAYATNPLGPFSEVAAPLFTDGDKGNIDANLFKDNDGKMYLYYAKEIWFSGSFVENQIYVVEMNNYTSAKNNYTFCIKATQDWEKISYLGALRWNEAPCVFRKDNIYYLMYSANCYNDDDYAIGYATSNSPMGEWIKYSGNPILKKTNDVWGPGSNCIISTPDNQMWIGYHSQVISGGTNLRQLDIDKLDWNGSNLLVNGPTTSLQSYPDNGFVYSGSSDDFNSSILDEKWFVASDNSSNWSLNTNPGKLTIIGINGDEKQGRHDYKNMFLQYAPAGDFFIYTEVQMDTTNLCEQADIFVWQNDDNYIRLGKGYIGTIVGSQKFEACKEINGIFTSWQVNNIQGNNVVIGIQKVGDTYSCWYWDWTNTKWVQVGPDITNVLLSPIKIGISAMTPGCNTNKQAAFNYFYISEY